MKNDYSIYKKRSFKRRRQEKYQNNIEVCTKGPNITEVKRKENKRVQQKFCV